ncbi:MAG: SH3 domain-containing protein [Atopobiaceae bacterium]|nr:SH3 domain-containing protein [Atopobiaceae bacterium]
MLRLLAGTLAMPCVLMLPSQALAAKKSYPTYTVKVDKGYLALRTAPAYDESNEIGELYTGDVVRVIDSTSNKTYWKVKTNKYQQAGWVNKNYLVPQSAPSGEEYKVTVAKGYLALRTAPAYDESNEIGELYTGDTVTVQDKSNGQYWWVYSPKYGKSGYVNKDYLVKK